MASTATKLTVEEKFTLITQNLDEVLGGDRLKKVLEERDAVAYWGTAPTGRPHLGYFVPLTKIADFLTAGVEVKVLLADVHAFLDNLKAPISLVNRRVDYYRYLLTAVFRSLQLPLHLVTFVVGSTYQYSERYSQDKQRLAAITTDRNARKAGAEVVKEVESPLLSGMLYPLLQALDEEHLGVDFQFGGVDQRKIFTYAEGYLPKLGYAKRAHLMNKMVPGLAGGKMSSSDPNSKIDFFDSPSLVESKLAAAHCEEGVLTGNGIIAFVRNVIVPIGELLKTQGRSSDRSWAGEENAVFSIEGEDGILRDFVSIESLEKQFEEKNIKSSDLKRAVAKAINSLLKPIQEDLSNDPEFQKIEQEAYPTEESVIGAVDDAALEVDEAAVDMSKEMSATEKFNLITRNVAEVLDGERLQKILEKRNLRAYFEFMPVDRPRTDFFLPLLKIIDCVKAGVEVTILLADVDAFLGTIKLPTTVDNLQPPTARRNDYHRLLLTAIFQAFNVPLSSIKFVVASTFQYSRKYNEDLHVLSALTEEYEARDVQFSKAGSEPPANVALRTMMAPLFQTLDEEHLNIDFRISTTSLRPTFVFSSTSLPKLSYSPKSHLLTASIPGVNSGKMSEIDFLDPSNIIKNKIKAAVCEPGGKTDSGVPNEVLGIVRAVLAHIGQILLEQGRGSERVWCGEDVEGKFILSVKEDPKFGTKVQNFTSVDELEAEYKLGSVHPGDLKNAVTLAVDTLLGLVRKELEGMGEEWIIAGAEAYPVKVKVEKKKKDTSGRGGPLDNLKGIKKVIEEVVI